MDNTTKTYNEFFLWALFLVTKDTFLIEETSTNMLVGDVLVSLSHMKLRTARTAMTDIEF
jgi:hypothetical protein